MEGLAKEEIEEGRVPVHAMTEIQETGESFRQMENRETKGELEREESWKRISSK